MKRRELRQHVFEMLFRVEFNTAEELEEQLRIVENPEKFYYKFSTLYYGISITKKTIEWCKHVREGKALIDFI